MTTMHIDEYSAWICIEGLAAPVYEVQRENNSSSCWIASQVGKVSHSSGFQESLA
jgi:hypothetical protein